jgi:hypothetical protein
MIRNFAIRRMGRYWLSSLLVIMMTALAANAQYAVSTYTFAQTTGTYVPITGGTLISATIPDNFASTSIALTPGFNFCGTVYTNAFVTSDGLITLGGTTAVNSTNGISTAIPGPLLSPFNTNLIGSNASGAMPDIRYQLVGNEHVFQWNDISRIPASTDQFSFQARLNYVTGAITYVYNVTSVGTSISFQPSIGIRTANSTGNWQNRTVTSATASTWAASAPGTLVFDLCRFTSFTPNPKQPVNGQTYIYTPPPACNAVSTLPVAGTVSATPGTLCISGNVKLNFTPATVMPTVTGITYKWQTSPTVGGTYTDIPGAITNVPTYTTAVPITASAYFKCVVLCNGTNVVLTSAASSQVVVNNPGTPTGVAGTRCGPGSVMLSATGAAGVTFRWYDAATGGTPLFMGPNFNTPYTATSRNFYVSSGTAAIPGASTVGAGALTTADNEVTMFSGDYGGYKHQYLITEAELIAAGFSPGANINSISVDNASGTDTYNGFSLRLKSTTSTVLTSAFETGVTPVFGPVNYMTTLGTNTFTLTSPFTWSGGSLLIETCWSNGGLGNSYSNIKYDNTTFAAAHQYHDDGQTPGVICDAATSGFTMNRRPQFKFNYNTLCESPRLPVAATITTPPAVTKTAPSAVCNNSVGTITVASNPMSNYTTYSWTSAAADLYSDAAATAPYTAGNAPTVYMKSSVAGQHAYYLYATGGTPSACAFADTVKIWVQPSAVTIKGFPDTLCAPSAYTTLQLSPATGYTPNSIQWQESVNGSTFTDIAGANATSFVTPLLTANRYYKAIIKSGTGTSCQAPVKFVVIANPQLLSWADSFHCGPGAVTLNAQAGGNGTIRWYNSATATIPVAVGNPWTTSPLSATTTYYVEAGAGPIQPQASFIGSSTLPADQNAYLASYATAVKSQWMITGAELQAAGFFAGNITTIGFDVTTKSGTTNIASLKYSMKAVTGPLGSALQTGMQQVFSATNFNPVANSVNIHTLQTPFYWDGVSNLVIEECSYSPTNQFGVVNVKGNADGPCNIALTGTTGASALNFCTVPGPPSSSPQRPNTLIGMVGGCHSPRQLVKAYIRPVPVVNLGPDMNKCVDAGYAEVLDAGLQPDVPQFRWDDNSTGQTRLVNTNGTYNVKVTNQYGCSGSDTINVILRANPVVNLGNDTSVCNGVVLTLNAGDGGAQYQWSTGESTQTIQAHTAGTYNVFVTNSAACTKSDTIIINMAGELPSVQDIQVTNNGQRTFHFNAIDPQYVVGYDWDFGDGSPHSTATSPTYTYANPGNYIVVLRLKSSCGYADEFTSAHILGINQLNVGKDELTVYPNPARAAATIENHGTLKMQEIAVYNVLGQVVYKAKANSKDKHTLSLERFTSGVYTIQIFTDKGTVARKLEIVK